MVKLIRLLIILFAIYIGIQIFSNVLTEGYESTYQVGEFEVYEKRTKKIKNEIDNYYFEIRKGEKVFSIQTNKNISISRNVIGEIKYFNDNVYECVLPITKRDKIITDIICEQNGIYYYYNSIAGVDGQLDEFANNLVNYRINFNNSDKEIKSNNYITAYDNFSDDLYIGLENYKGIYLLDKKRGFRNIRLLKKDVYTKEISTFANGYYVVADYEQEYEFNKFYIVNVKNHSQRTIISDKKISMYSYIQGAVGNSVYIIDTTNKLQYELDIKNETVTIVGNENDGVKLYRNNEWSTVNIYDALNNKLYFEEINTTFQDKNYARVDKIGNEQSGYYYLYEQSGSIYNVYRINVQNLDNKIFLFSTDNIDNIIYDFDFVLYKDNSYVKYYSDLTGNKTLVKFDEVNFNRSLKLGY